MKELVNHPEVNKHSGKPETFLGHQCRCPQAHALEQNDEGRGPVAIPLPVILTLPSLTFLQDTLQIPGTGKCNF